MASASRFWMLAASDDAIRVGLQALAMAEELGLDELQAHALDNIGVSRIGKDDERGFADLERSIAIADSINSVESARAYGNLASALADFGELERGFEMLGEARRRAERFGLDDWLLWLRGEVAYEPYCAGEWDEGASVLDGDAVPPSPGTHAAGARRHDGSHRRCRAVARARQRGERPSGALACARLQRPDCSAFGS